MDKAKINNDAIIIRSSDNSYNQKKKLSEYDHADEEGIFLKFTDLKPGLAYTIEYLPEGSRYPLIEMENVPFADMMKTIKDESVE